MVGDKMLHRMVEQISSSASPRALFLQWNISRTRYVAGLYLLMQLMNIGDGAVFEDFGMGLSCVCIIVLNVAFLLFVFVCKRCSVSENVAYCIHMTYWLLLPFACLFFFVYDISLGGLPTNLLIIYLFLSTIPILNTANTVIAFALPYVINVVVGVMFGANLSYYFYGMMFAVCGAVVSVVANRQYVMLIERLRYSSTYDQLTGLITRHMGIPRAEMLAMSCQRKGQTLAVFMTDVDLFKNYNDTFGHVAGDDVLKSVADAVKSCFKRASDVVMRFGGEEFVMFAEVEDYQDACMLAQSMEDAVRQLGIASAPESPEKCLTISVGVYVASIGEAAVDEAFVTRWVEKADEALYQAKSRGRARSVVTSPDVPY